MKFIFAGGASEVGGSCIYIQTENKGIVLDAGIRQSAVKDPLPDFRAIQDAGKVDAIIISHAHMDHIGSLPVLSKAYPAAKIYMTPMTMNLSRVLLYDSLKLMGRREEEIPIYSEEDVLAMFSRIVPVHYQSECTVFDDYSFTFYPAGHIAGAACVYLKTPEGTIFYSGDMSFFAQKTIEGLRIPRLRPDALITESTYGDKLHANRQAEELRLVNAVKDHIQQGHKVLIPAFALGRAQEVQLILRQAFSNQSLPQVPVYIDGMVRDINRVYKQFPTYLRSVLSNRIFKGNEPFYTNHIQEVKQTDDREELLNRPGAAVFISSSGMLTGGPSMMYAKKLAPREDACIILTGYQDEESPGRALLNLLEDSPDKRITLDGTTVEVKCPVLQVGLSAHGDQSEICAMIDRLEARHIFIVHGESDVISTLGNELSKDIRRRIYKPSGGEMFEIFFHNKRRQLDDGLRFTMHRNDAMNEQNAAALRQYIMTQYPRRSFTPQQLYTIWSGERVSADTSEENSELLNTFQDILLESIQFIRDPRRMYLLTPNTDQAILEYEAQKKKAQFATMQEVEQVLKGMCLDLSVRKYGFNQSEHIAVLIMDYPDSFKEEKRKDIDQQLHDETGWHLRVNPAVNHQAVRFLLGTLFSENLGKISYYEHQKTYSVTTSGLKDTYKDIIDKFRNITGWNLVINGKVEESKVSAKDFEIREDWFNPQEGEPMEQNMALNRINIIFADSAIKPYKKGVPSDQYGKYIELYFIVPEEGRKVSSLLQTCADTIGMRIHISQSVNQNALMVMVMDLCREYGIELQKNPSYHAMDKLIKLKTDTEIPKEMVETFFEKTGFTIQAN